MSKLYHFNANKSWECFIHICPKALVTNYYVSSRSSVDFLVLWNVKREKYWLEAKRILISVAQPQLSYNTLVPPSVSQPTLCSPDWTAIDAALFAPLRQHRWWWWPYFAFSGFLLQLFLLISDKLNVTNYESTAFKSNIFFSTECGKKNYRAYWHFFFYSVVEIYRLKLYLFCIYLFSSIYSIPVRVMRTGASNFGPSMRYTLIINS